MKSTSNQLLLTVVLLLAIAFSCKQQHNSAGLQPLEKLRDGNNRFSHSQPIHPDEGRQRLVEISDEQHPFAVVISCSDSRVPPELIFDQGLGDLFVIRTAGNIIGGLELGSVEYAIEHLNVKLVIVLGHEECGAVKAFVNAAAIEGHIHDIVDSIRNEEEIKEIPENDKNRLEHCIEANIRHTAQQLKTQSLLLSTKILQGELEVRTACYNLRKGIVTFYSN